MFVYMWYSVEILYKGENWEFTVNKGSAVINKVYRKTLVSDIKKILHEYQGWNLRNFKNILRKI